MERMNAGKLHYYDDPEINAAALSGQLLLARYNATAPDEEELRARMLPELLGKVGSPCTVKPPFRCDYGKHITVGKRFYANSYCTIIDVAPVTIGDNVLLGPNVQIITAGHPIHPDSRNSKYEYGIPITIGDNVWIGAGAIILPGVNIGSNTVIGAGAVVTKDVPDGVVAAGNPCRIIKEITEEDKKYYYKNLEFDSEAWNNIISES